jgi:hypothetical protein
LFASPPIDGAPREGWDVGNPPPVVFARELDFKVKCLRLSRVFGHFKLSVAELRQMLVWRCKKIGLAFTERSDDVYSRCNLVTLRLF